MMKKASNRRPQTQKPRGPRPRSVFFDLEPKVRDKEAARGKGWLDEDLLEEIEEWKEWI